MKREFSLVLNTAPHRGGILHIQYMLLMLSKHVFFMAAVVIGRFRTLLTFIFQCLRFD